MTSKSSSNWNGVGLYAAHVLTAAVTLVRRASVPASESTQAVVFQRHRRAMSHLEILELIRPLRWPSTVSGSTYSTVAISKCRLIPVLSMKSFQYTHRHIQALIMICYSMHTLTYHAGTNSLNSTVSLSTRHGLTVTR